MNNTLAIVIVAALLLFFFYEQPSNPLGVPPPPGGANGSPQSIHAVQSGAFAPVFALPGLGQAYAIAKPIADSITTPAINKLNKVLGTPPNPLAPGLPGTGDLNIVINKDGTQTVSVKNPNWYTRNIGEPVSKGATGVVHAIESIF